SRSSPTTAAPSPRGGRCAIRSTRRRGSEGRPVRPALYAAFFGDRGQECADVGGPAGAPAVVGELVGGDLDQLHGVPAAPPVGDLLGFAELPFLKGAGRVVLHKALKGFVVRR